MLNFSIKIPKKQHHQNFQIWIFHIVVEGDAQLVIQALKGVDAPTPILKIVEGARKYLQMFCSWKAVHTNRRNNTAAHLLARESKNVNDYIIWVEDSPPCIENQLLNDVIALDVCPD